MNSRWLSVVRDRFLLFPLLTPAVLLAAGNDGFGFDAPGFVDPFIYLGNFWHYAEHLPRFDHDYKISRLPWVLPGFAAHVLGGDIVGAYILNYLMMAAGSVALYLLIRDALNDRTTASVVAVAWACCTQGHGVGGWNYHMVAAGAYYLAACWLVLRAARGPSPQRSALLAGVLLACAVHTHLFVVAFFPLVGLLYWSASSPEQVRPAARGGRHLLLLAIGALSITMVLMVINGVTGGEWLFFENQIDFTLREWGSETYPLWKDDPFEWLPTAMHLVIPVLFMLAGLTQLSRSTGQPSSRLRNSLVVQAWAAFAILCFFQFARRVPMLDQDYFAFVAYFYAFPCVAAALASDDAFEGRDTRLLTVAVAALVLVGSLMVLLPGAFPRFVADTSAAIGLAGLPPVALPVAVGFVGVVVMMLLSGPMRLIAFALWFAVVNTWIAPSPADYGIRTPGSQQQMVALFREADRFTTELDPTLGGIKYWFPKEDIATSTGTLALNWVFDSFLSTRGWSASLFGQESPGPAIDTLTVEHLSSTTCLGLLSSVGQHDDLKRKLSIHFDRLGHPLTEVAHRRFERPALTFALTVFKPLSATETLPQCWPLRTQ